MDGCGEGQLDGAECNLGGRQMHKGIPEPRPAVRRRDVGELANGKSSKTTGLVGSPISSVVVV